MLLVIACAAMTANAACFNPFGCAPKTYEECIADAVIKPTTKGVEIATRECISAKSKIDEKQNLILAETRAKAWAQLSQTQPPSADEWLVKMGKPFLVTGPSACWKSATSTASDTSCYLYQWTDGRPGRSSMYYRAQFQNNAQKLIWMWTRDSVNESVY